MASHAQKRLRAVASVAGLDLEVVTGDFHHNGDIRRAKEIALGGSRELMVLSEHHVHAQQHAVAAEFAKFAQRRLTIVRVASFDAVLDSARTALDAATSEWPFDELPEEIQKRWEHDLVAAAARFGRTASYASAGSPASQWRANRRPLRESLGADRKPSDSTRHPGCRSTSSPRKPPGAPARR
jgi:hypothetical protein